MATRHVQGNLPADLNSFVGRRQEVHDIRQLLSEARLVSVIGPGGVGKSRLALRVASEFRRAFRDGVWLVELASVSEPSLLSEAIAGAIRVPERSNRDAVDALRTYLADRDVLLVLDNCEQLRDACAALLAATLPIAPGVRVLATSQDVLGLAGEMVYRLQPLAVPDLGGGLESAEIAPAAALFADRAASALNDFRMTTENADAIVEICKRLDGLPLAIELAAAHARVLTPAQILERLDDRFQLLATRGHPALARHQSLKAAVEWSYDLCSEPERLAWNRLSVFPSTFDLPAAEAVCAGEGLTTASVEDAVGQLVDRSVLISEPHRWGMRYRLLESIREYGLQMLRESANQDQALSELVLRSSHLNWYVALGDRFDRAWFGAGQHELLEQWQAELPNVRAALSFAVEQPAVREHALMLAGNLGFFWRVSAMREGQSWLVRLLKVDGAPSLGRARALVALAWLMTARAQPEGEAIVAEALTIAERLDPERVPRAMLVRGTLMSHRDPHEARAVLQEAVAAAQTVGSTADTAYALLGLGWSLGLAGERDEAEALVTDSKAICVATGELWWRGVVDFRRSLVAWMNDDPELMAAAAMDALRASHLVPDALTCADAVCVIGAAHVGRDDPRAAYLLGAAERYWADAGGSVVSTPPWGPWLAEAKNRCKAAMGNAAFAERYGQGKEDGLVDAMAAVLGMRPEPKQEPATRDFALTRRELEIAELIAKGLTNREIAATLVISIRTAETHVQHILNKTGFFTRSHVAAWHAGRSQPTDS